METDNKDERRRLFFGTEVHAPWPTQLPDARTLKAKHRHLTLAFLGLVSYEKVRTLLPHIPRPTCRVGPVGIFDSCLLLPQRHPKVVTWHVNPFGHEDSIALYQETLISYLAKEGYCLDHSPFLKHVTIGRTPFSPKKWRQTFHPLPLYLLNLHLYESHAGMCYEPIWTHDFLPPFEEMEHTADIAFCVYGESVEQIFLHAQIALAFECTDLLPFLDSKTRVTHLEEIIIRLNEIIAKADREIGTPFKAVSFHGNIIRAKGALMWEMIIDV